MTKPPAPTTHATIPNINNIGEVARSEFETDGSVVGVARGVRVAIGAVVFVTAGNGVVVNVAVGTDVFVAVGASATRGRVAGQGPRF